MLLKIVGAVILVITWFNDRSGFRRSVLLKCNRQKELKVLEEDPIEDVRVESYKTISYVLLSLFWFFLKYIQFLIPLIILVNLLAYIRHLRYPDKIHCYTGKAKYISTLTRMFCMAGLNLSFFVISNLQFGIRLFTLVGCLTVLLFAVYFIVSVSHAQKTAKLIPVIIPIVIFSFGCIVSVNSFYGVKTVANVETVVEQIHSGRRTDGISIPDEDAVDGETYFSASIRGVEMGDKVQIRERIGCLGIKWITISIDRSGA